MITILATVILAFVVLLAAVAGMAIGVMRGRAPIRGSCGGLNNGGCELCDSRRCREETSQ